MALITLISSSVALKLIATLDYKLQENARENESWKLAKQGCDPIETGLEPSHFIKMANIMGFLLTVLCQKPYKYSPKRLPEQFIFYGIILGNFIMGMWTNQKIFYYLVIHNFSCNTFYLFNQEYCFRVVLLPTCFNLNINL